MLEFGEQLRSCSFRQLFINKKQKIVNNRIFVEDKGEGGRHRGACARELSGSHVNFAGAFFLAFIPNFYGTHAKWKRNVGQLIESSQGSWYAWLKAGEFVVISWQLESTVGVVGGKSD